MQSLAACTPQAFTEPYCVLVTELYAGDMPKNGELFWLTKQLELKLGPEVWSPHSYSAIHLAEFCSWMPCLPAIED